MATAVVPRFGVHKLCFTKTVSEINRSLESLVGTYESQIDGITATAPRDPVNFASTFGELAKADGHASLMSAELTLPALVSSDSSVRSASSKAKQQLQQMWARAYARPDLYSRLWSARETASTPEEQYFVARVLGKFRQAGAALSGETREEFLKLDKQCMALAAQIEQNINEDCTTVPFNEEELDGCSEDFLKALPSGSFLSKECSIKAPTYVPIMRLAKRSETRRRMMELRNRQCMEQNGPLLDELVTTRDAAASKLGFASHADRMLESKMAASASRAKDFCQEMFEKVRPLRDAEMTRLAGRKAASGEPGGLHAWDLSFYEDMLKREELDLDDEHLKQFFPLESTIDQMLEVYSQFLGLSFQRNDSLPVWHQEVVAFEVLDGTAVVGHLFLDQFPRDGKFGHQMILPLAPCFTDGADCCVPACVNVSNLSRPEGGKPALLRWSEMKTLFHELGHAMHCICTSTRFSLLSWAWPMVPWPGGVEQDFLEVPSMALEKFACEPALLARVSRHVRGETIGAGTLVKLQEQDKWMKGIQESRFFAMALFDLEIHSRAPPYAFDGDENLTVQQLLDKIVTKYTGVPPIPGTHPAASWYHMVIGYDAGYYGYGWSDVYAADIFDMMLHSPEGLLSPETGRRLREAILSPCASRSGNDMLRCFLGREPSTEPFLRRIGAVTEATS